MTDIWKLDEVYVCGGNRKLDPRLPFQRAHVVLQRAEEYLLVHAYTEGREAVGVPLTADEWSGLQDCDKGFVLPRPMMALPRAALWLFGPEFPRGPISKHPNAGQYLGVDSEHPVRVYDHVGNVHGTEIMVLLVDEEHAKFWRTRVAGEALERAWTSVKLAQVGRARDDAELAVALDGVSLPSFLLLAGIYGALDRPARAAAMSMFVQRILNERDDEAPHDVADHAVQVSHVLDTDDWIIKVAHQSDHVVLQIFDRRLDRPLAPLRLDSVTRSRLAAALMGNGKAMS